MSVNLKKIDLKRRTQEYIAKNIDKEFVKKYFRVNDSIEFNMEFLIEANGEIATNKIFIHTKSEVFNTEIKSIILTLPKFIPPVALINKKPFSYVLNFSPEFYVNSQNEFNPIYREELPSVRLNLFKDELKNNIEFQKIKMDIIRV